MNRVTEVTDRLGRRLTRDYDASGRLASVTLPGVAASFTYNLLDNIDTITDPNGQVWRS